MKTILKDYLFNHGILVCQNKEALDEAFAARFMLNRKYNIRITAGKDLVTRDMVPYVAEKLGQNVPEPFYRGFPDSVRELSEDQLLFDQLLHYFRTYGMGDFSEAGHSLFENVDDLERKAFNEACECKDFTVISEGEAVIKLGEFVEELMAGTRPLSDDQYEFVCTYVKEYGYEVQNCASKNLAVRLLIDFRDTHYAAFLSMSDVIKVLDELNYREYGNTNIKKLNFKNQDRKFITDVINSLFHAGQCDIRNCFEKKAVWNGLLHHIHYKPVDDVSAQFLQAMRGSENFSVFAEFEQAMKERDIRAAVMALKNGKGSGAVLRNLNYIISRCENQEDVEFVMKQMGSSNGIVLLQLLTKYSTSSDKKDQRTFKFTKHNKLLVHAETTEEQDRRQSFISKETADMLCKAIEVNLKEHFKNTLGKVYIAPEVERLALPMQENTSSGGYGVLSKGSRLRIAEGKKVRAFTYWEKVDDIDLSVIGITKDGRQTEFSWRTMAGRQSDAITYSGDETSGYHGGSEYFDLDLDKIKEMYPDISHLILCNNVYSCIPFDKCVCRAGYMLRDINDSGEVFEPKTVQTSFTIDCDSTFAYLFAIDLEKRDFIWLNIARDSSERVAGTTSLGFLLDYFDVTSVMNMKKFFTMLAAEVVDSKEEADVIVSDENYDAAEGQEIIRSLDFERIIQLMNA